jgi:hypothetical protein
MDRHRTTVRLPEQLLKQAKRKAAAEGKTLTSLIEDGLRLVVTEQPKRHKPVMPRVSTARGGVLPGIDLSDGSELQALDDLKYIERLKSGVR